MNTHRLSGILTAYSSGRRLWLALIMLFLSQGCGHLQSVTAGATVAIVPAQSFHFQDGGEARYFSIDKRLEWRSSEPIASFLFVVSGSDCTDMQAMLPHYFRGLEGESGGIRIFILQKRHIHPSSWNLLKNCSDDFIKADHPSRWIADQTEFIDAQLALAAADGVQPKRIAVLGISEGGDIVAALAQQNTYISHLAIVGNGGMNTLDAYRLQAEKYGFTQHLGALAALDNVPAEPDAIEHFIAGRSWRYWAELRDLQQSRQLLVLDIPILIGMGDADTSVPVESALDTRAQFRLHKRHNLTVLIYPGADHGLRSAERKHMPDFLFALDNFLQK